MIAAFHTLGCKTNAYETQAILEQFEKAGFDIGDFSESCDVYVINTCAVTQEAARKSRQMTGRCKKKNPDALVVVTGCYAQDAAESILDDCLADMVVGNSEKSQIVSLVTEKLGNMSERNILVKNLTACRDYEDQHITGQGDHVRAYVKIQDGCNRFCSYCLIPFMRGRSRSRNLEDILDETKILAAAGYHEIVLTGIDISSFEIDGEDEPMAVLVEKLAEIPGIDRIRLGSLEVGIASETLIERLSQVHSFCPQFHLSLQSGCDTVLKRMNRHYTSDEYAASVESIRKYFPEAGITTDIITGFPGETEDEFSRTVEFAEKIAFSRIHVFPYSRRNKTKADKMPGQITRAVKEARARQLIGVGERLRQEYESRLIGKKCSILVEEVVTEDNGQVYLAGYTPEYVKILAATDASAEEAADMINREIEVIPSEFSDGILYC